MTVKRRAEGGKNMATKGPGVVKLGGVMIHKHKANRTPGQMHPHTGYATVFTIIFISQNWDVD